MKPPFKNHKSFSFMVFCLAAITAIVTCNLWLLYCGRCVVNDFLRIPLIGWTLIGANLVAGVIFLVIKRRKKLQQVGLLCSACRAHLHDSWLFCPHCGAEHADKH